MPVVWSRRKYSAEEFTSAVESNQSWRGVARMLGKNPDAGGIYLSFQLAAEELGLDLSHFTDMGWNTGDHSNLLSKSRKVRSLEEILIKNSDYLSTNNLKKKLLKAGLLESRCYAPFCPISNPSVHPFTGEPVELKFSLDHINGDRRDNRIENLRLLCYHCHGLTETWCGKNKPR